jgi:hypothetical protein
MLSRSGEVHQPGNFFPIRLSSIKLQIFRNLIGGRGNLTIAAFRSGVPQRQRGVVSSWKLLAWVNLRIGKQ